MPKLAFDKGVGTGLAKLGKPITKLVTEAFDEFDAAAPTELPLEKTANLPRADHFTCEMR
ncbi:hypothetical protein A5694_01155 [Mycolicibacter sinensis]|nr:hypothetical protein A5694_01155 [Mycolicibacter sinensis]